METTKSRIDARKMDDDIWDDIRSEALIWAGKRDKAFRSSQKAYRRGDKEKAKTDSNLGKYYKRQCDEANKIAADEIFYHMNENRPLTEIDLHGLYVYEAMEKLEQRIIDALDNRIRHLDVIVGQGNHSDDGPKIKPSVVEFARNNNIHYIMGSENPGCIRFSFGRTDESSSDKTFKQYETRREAPVHIIKIPVQRVQVPAPRVTSSQYSRGYETGSSRLFGFIIWIAFAYIMSFLVLSKLFPSTR